MDDGGAPLETVPATPATSHLYDLPPECEEKIWEYAAEDIFNSAGVRQARAWSLVYQPPYVFVETFGRRVLTPASVNQLRQLIWPLMQTNRLSRDVACRYLCLMRMSRFRGYVWVVPRIDFFVLNSQTLEALAASPDFQDSREPQEASQDVSVSKWNDLHVRNIHQLKYARNVVLPGGLFETPNSRWLRPILCMRHLKVVYIDVAQMCYPRDSEPSQQEEGAGGVDDGEDVRARPPVHACHNPPGEMTQRYAESTCDSASGVHEFLLDLTGGLGATADNFRTQFRLASTTFTTDVAEARPLRAAEQSYELTEEEMEDTWQYGCSPIPVGTSAHPHDYVNVAGTPVVRPDCVMIAEDKWKGAVSGFWHNLGKKKGIVGAAVVHIGGIHTHNLPPA